MSAALKGAKSRASYSEKQSGGVYNRGNHRIGAVEHRRVEFSRHENEDCESARASLLEYRHDGTRELETDGQENRLGV